MREEKFRMFLEVGVSLSAERNYNRLLERILLCVMELSNCDAGTLYLLEDGALHFKIMRNNTMNTYSGGDGSQCGLPPVALNRESVCALALLDDETIDYINREMSNVVLSLDGRQEINDRMRPTVNGKGSYEVIVPKFQKLTAGRGTKDYYVRGTFTRDNLDFAEDVLHMGDLGFRHVSVEPCSGPSDDPYAIREEDLGRVEKEYEKLAQKLLAFPGKPAHPSGKNLGRKKGQKYRYKAE